MDGPIAFISHFRVADGKLDEYLRLAHEQTERLYADKPGTEAFLAYLDREGMRTSIVHLFGGAEAMDRHFVGAEERSALAMRFLEPAGWEIYGPASEGAVETIRRAAASAGVVLTVHRELAFGFSRTGDAPRRFPHG